MAKHAHRLILMNKKTWKCNITGCSFFVHLGLAHLLMGKTALCWGCDEQFIIDEFALKEEKPRCIDCRLADTGEVEPAVSTTSDKMLEALKKLGLK